MVAYVISNLEQEIIKISAQITVLSTGGAGQFFSYRNPENATGDGLGAAYEAKFLEGFHLFNFTPLHFTQINGNTFLISEASWEGVFKNHIRQKVDRISPGPNLLRDIVARSIAEVVNQTGDDYVLWIVKPLVKKNLKISSPP